MQVPQPAIPASERPARDRGLLLLVGGAVVLIVLGLISIPLAARRTPTLAPATTPEGTVQRFYQAAYSGDYPAAYALLSPDTQRELSLIELQQQLSADLQNSQMRVRDTTTHDASATVHVQIVHVQPGSIFGSGEWQSEHDVLLQRAGDGWSIVSGPFYVAPTP